MEVRQFRFVRLAVALVSIAAACSVLAADASAKPFVYVPNSGSDNITPFAAAAGGSLTPAPLVPTGDGPLGTAATPDGHFLYAANNGGDSISAFLVAPEGTLEPVTGSPYPTAINPNAVAVGPDGGRVLYASNFGSDSISVFSIGAQGGLTALGTPVATQDGPSQLSFTLDGKFLYVPNFGSSSVSAFAVGADGTLTAVPGSPFPVGGTFPNNSEVSPNGKFLYVSRRAANRIDAFSIAASGALSPVPGSPFTAGSPEGIGFTADGGTLYTANFSGNLVQSFAVAASGALTLGATTPVGVGPTALETNPDRTALYVANASTSSVSSFTIAAGGALTPAPGSPVPTGGTSPSGRSFAVVDTDERLDFAVFAKRKQKQRGKKIRLKVKVSADEALKANVSGVITGRGLKKPVKLRGTSVSLAAGEAARVVLKPKQKSGVRKIARLLKSRRKVKATISVGAFDEVGNAQIRKVKVGLK